jgi:hypothetical protein
MPLSTAIGSGERAVGPPKAFLPYGNQVTREHLWASIRASADRAKDGRKAADRLACGAWNHLMLGYKGPAQPSPTLGDALNAGFGHLEVRCLGCDTHQTVGRLISCAGQRRRRSTNRSGTCVAKNALRVVARGADKEDRASGAVTANSANSGCFALHPAPLLASRSNCR